MLSLNQPPALFPASVTHPFQKKDQIRSRISADSRKDDSFVVWCLFSSCFFYLFIWFSNNAQALHLVNWKEEKLSVKRQKKSLNVL